MKKQVLSVVVCVLFFSSAAQAGDSTIQSRFEFLALSYTYGAWIPWACVEKGVPSPADKPLDRVYNSCNGRMCPFKAPLFSSPGCQDTFPKVLEGPHVGINARITIPGDLKLVTPNGNVVSDQVCVGDRFKIVKGANKGEYWNDGGNSDSPAIYWVDDVEKIVDGLLKFHEESGITADQACTSSAVRDGFVDPVTGIPVYTYPTGLWGGVNWGDTTGNMVCSTYPAYVESSLKTEGDYYVVTGDGTFDLELSIPVRCMFYYYGGSGGQSQCPDYTLLKVPTVITYESGYEDYMGGAWGSMGGSAGNRDYYTKSDFFSVGNLTLTKKIRVGSPTPASVDLEVAGKDELVSGKSGVVRLIVKNKGAAGITIKKAYASSDYKFISCDSLFLESGKEAECLLSVTPQTGKGLKVSVDYEYPSCASTKNGTASVELIGSRVVSLTSSVQVYSISVHGGCENQYYGCSVPDKDGKFAAGYKCYNTGDQYYSPVKERFDLRFDLPDLTSKTVLGASLNLFATNANRAQEVKVFSGKVDWTPTSCSASGDICSRPYCEQCASLFDFAGGVQRSAQTISGGKVSYDLTDQVKEAYSSGLSTLSLQLRGEEDVWASAGKDSCGRLNDWVKQDVEFAGSVGGKPYLEIVYK